LKINLIWSAAKNNEQQYFCHSVSQKCGRVEFLKSRISKSFFEELRQDKNIVDITTKPLYLLEMRKEAFKERNLKRRMVENG